MRRGRLGLPLVVFRCENRRGKTLLASFPLEVGDGKRSQGQVRSRLGETSASIELHDHIATRKPKLRR